MPKFSDNIRGAILHDAQHGGLRIERYADEINVC